MRMRLLTRLLLASLVVQMMAQREKLFDNSLHGRERQWDHQPSAHPLLVPPRPRLTKLLDCY